MTATEQKLERARTQLDAAHRRMARVERSASRLPDVAAYEAVCLPAHRTDAQVDKEIERLAAAHRVVQDCQQLVGALEARLHRERRDAGARSSLDLTAIEPGWLVRDDVGWHRVIRVNAKSVTVETPWSWTERIPLDRILEAAA